MLTNFEVLWYGTPYEQKTLIRLIILLTIYCLIQRIVNYMKIEKRLSGATWVIFALIFIGVDFGIVRFFLILAIGNAILNYILKKQKGAEDARIDNINSNNSIDNKVL